MSESDGEKDGSAAARDGEKDGSAAARDQQFDAFLSVLKHLKAPTVSLDKFSGAPLDFKRFKRQFHSQVILNTDSFDERFQYLETFTTGEANKVVKGFSSLDSELAYYAVMKEFERRYGDSEIMVDCFIKKLLDWPQIHADDAKGLDSFALLLTECEHAVVDYGAARVLEYSENFKRIVAKLPYRLHDKWRSIVFDIREAGGRPLFMDLVKFVSREARKANDPTFGLQKKSPAPFPKDAKPKSSYMTDVSQASSTRCLFCQGEHCLLKCDSFATQIHSAKIDFLRKQGICFGCLNKGHIKGRCTNKSVCGVCKGVHPTALHFDHRPTAPDSSYGIHASSAVDCSDDCTLAIIPVNVRVKGGSRSLTTYAFFDSGSTTSFCDESLASALGVEGTPKRIIMHTMGTTQSIWSRQVPNLEITNLAGTNSVLLPDVYTKNSMPVSRKHIPKTRDLTRWPHLRDIPLPQVDAGIGLLLGNNVPDAYVPLETRVGPKGSPHATKTALGWVPWNLLRDVNSYEVSVNTCAVFENVDQLYDKIVAVDFPEVTKEKSEHSVDDQRFLQKMGDSEIQVDRHYELALPFRDEKPVLPDNEAYASQRLKGLRKKLSSDDTFYREYCQFMSDIIDKGYAEEVPEEDLHRGDNKVWYIPHHAVYHARKGKIRVVFDCSSRFKGVSLNDKLLQGPNLTNALFGVLLRFRQERYAIMGDIEKMFYQVKVPKEDRDSLRFLWWRNGDLTSEPRAYRMTVHLFGAVSSPSCSSYALQRAVQDNPALSESFYVDDFLFSVPTVSLAVDAVHQVMSLCYEGGFRLTKWVANSNEILQFIPECDRAIDVINSLDFDEKQTTERALGIVWNISSDDLVFYTNQPTVDDEKVSRRRLLSVTSSFYDPHGLLSPLVLPAKLLLQDLCRRGHGWDECLDEADLRAWRRWLADLVRLKGFAVGRCLQPDFPDIVNIQVHHFSDASDNAYGVVTYIRFMNQDGAISSSLLSGKCRVAPIKKVTTPRLELTAAVLAVKLNSLIMSELRYEIDEVFFWTDSQAVLKYIANTCTRFKTFVANRLSVIHQGSKVQQWNFIDGKANPGDIASRGMSPDDARRMKMWFEGPSFLWTPVDQWPTFPKVNVLSPDEVDVEAYTTDVSPSIEPHILDDLIEKSSSWTKLKRVLGWILNFIDRLKLRVGARKLRSRSVKHGNLSDLPLIYSQRAEVMLVKHEQQKYYSSEIQKLSEGLPVTRSSSIVRLDPFLQDGVLRVGGRLGNSPLQFGKKHQMLFSKNSRLSLLILQHIHRDVGHMGKNMMVAKLREKFWVPSPGAMIKRITYHCVICRKVAGQFAKQKMSDLPTKRVTSDLPPFWNTGMDYFGPFYIKQGRSQVKRYGIVFTCFLSRAIHIEVAHTLDTSSCINGVRRFIARRGKVNSITSDNGTNMVGADKELRESVKKWNQSHVRDFLHQRGITWNFNPPSASHFGGVWERMIRSVRRILCSLLREQPRCLDDESLVTLMCEVEHILNSRPISPLSDNPHDLDALTPNHLLMVKPDCSMPPGIFDPSDIYSRRRWRQIQYLANLFWKRWSREYLQTLQQRQKWLKTDRNLSVGDIVLVSEDSARSVWPLGRVTEVHPGKNGLVRVVTVKTRDSTVTRPVDKLCVVLEIN